MERFTLQFRFFTAARKKPGAVELCCQAVQLGVQVDLVDQMQQTPLHYAATVGNVSVARLLISLGLSVNLADCDGKTALDHAIDGDHKEVIRLLTSMGAHIGPRDVGRESRKRKRTLHATDICPYGGKRAAMVAWAYKTMEAEEPEVLREDVEVVHESSDFFACSITQTSKRAAKRIRRSAPCPQEECMKVSSVCARNKSGLASGLYTRIHIKIDTSTSINIILAPMQVSRHAIINIRSDFGISLELEHSS